MRDHRNLKAFQLADQLVEDVYKISGQFPDSEKYGLTSQLRRAAVSVPGNIVEGCGRYSEADLFKFLDYAFASLREAGYYLDLSGRLGFVTPGDLRPVKSLQADAAVMLSGLRRTVRKWKAS